MTLTSATLTVDALPFADCGLPDLLQQARVAYDAGDVRQSSLSKRAAG